MRPVSWLRTHNTTVGPHKGKVSVISWGTKDLSLIGDPLISFPSAPDVAFPSPMAISLDGHSSPQVCGYCRPSLHRGAMGTDGLLVQLGSDRREGTCAHCLPDLTSHMHETFWTRVSHDPINSNSNPNYMSWLTLKKQLNPPLSQKSKWSSNYLMSLVGRRRLNKSA